jgi:hypothetical protein
MGDYPPRLVNCRNIPITLIDPGSERKCLLYITIKKRILGWGLPVDFAASAAYEPTMAL